MTSSDYCSLTESSRLTDEANRRSPGGRNPAGEASGLSERLGGEPARTSGGIDDEETKNNSHAGPRSREQWPLG
jgi:hypothetical protein